MTKPPSPTWVVIERAAMAPRYRRAHLFAYPADLVALCRIAQRASDEPYTVVGKTVDACRARKVPTCAICRGIATQGKEGLR